MEVVLLLAFAATVRLAPGKSAIDASLAPVILCCALEATAPFGAAGSEDEGPAREDVDDDAAPGAPGAALVAEGPALALLGRPVGDARVAAGEGFDCGDEAFAAEPGVPDRSIGEALAPEPGRTGEDLFAAGA